MLGLWWARGFWDEWNVVPCSNILWIKGRAKEENAQLQLCRAERTQRDTQISQNGKGVWQQGSWEILQRVGKIWIRERALCEAPTQKPRGRKENAPLSPSQILGWCWADQKGNSDWKVTCRVDRAGLCSWTWRWICKGMGSPGRILRFSWCLPGVIHLPGRKEARERTVSAPGTWTRTVAKGCRGEGRPAWAFRADQICFKCGKSCL